MRQATQLRLAGLLLAATLACAGPKQPCFVDASLVADPRIIAVRTDPPETVVDLSGAQPIPATDVSVLVLTAIEDVLGENGRAVQVSDFETLISICLPPPISEVNAQPGCPAGSQVIADLPAVPGLQTPFAYAPPLEMIQAAIAQDPVHGLAGVQLRLQIDVLAAPTIRSTKVLTFHIAGSPASVNHGLEITGIEESVGGVHTIPPKPQVLKFIVAQDSGMRPLIGPGPGATDAIETYLAYDNSGQLVSLREHVTYAFYAGNDLFIGTPINGQTAIYTGAAGALADEPDPGAPDPPDGLVTAEPLFIGPQTGAVWVVARDGRGAETWASFSYTAEDLRACWLTRTPGLPAHCPNVFFGCN